MWLPWTSRTGAGVLSWSTLLITCPTQGPAAFTRARARISRGTRVASSRMVSRHSAPCRTAARQRVRGAMVAPWSAASRAFSTTRRESSTQQSEYSKPRRKRGCNGAPAGSSRRFSARVGGSFWRPPRWS